MRPLRLAVLALLCLGHALVRALCSDCRWRFEGCQHAAARDNCSVVLRRWCPRTNASDVSDLFATNTTRWESYGAATTLLTNQCDSEDLTTLCQPHACLLLPRPCAWSRFRVVLKSCAAIVRSRTRKPCCHPVTRAVITCPCRARNVSCPFVSTFNSFVHTRSAKQCHTENQLSRAGRTHSFISIHDIEIGLLGVVILLFLIFCSIVGVRRHSFRQETEATPLPLPVRIPRSSSAPLLVPAPRPMLFPTPGDPVPQRLLPPTFDR